MKKLGIFLVFILLASGLQAQGVLRPVPRFPDSSEKRDMTEKGIIPATSKKVWRFDASIAIVELSYDKDTKKVLANSFSAVGPAFGLQNYVPTSATDPTPFNNWGVSGAFLLGKSIYEPDLAAAKVAIVVNIMQYFKFGTTYTFNTPTNVSHFGVFFGGGITF
jgi:hypothetical protein